MRPRITDTVTSHTVNCITDIRDFYRVYLPTAAGGRRVYLEGDTAEDVMAKLTQCQPAVQALVREIIHERITTRTTVEVVGVIRRTPDGWV